MLKSIGETLVGKQKLFEKNTSTEHGVQRIVKKFIQETYPQALPFISVGYQSEIRTVSIVTSNKSVASELLMHTKDIRAQLRSERIGVDTIIVR